MTHGEQIQQWLDMGWSLLPVYPNDKAPTETGWSKWCVQKRPSRVAEFADCNVGVALGPASDLCCVDVDDEDSFQAFLIERHKDVGDTRTHSSRPGRFHYFFKYPKDGREYPVRKFAEWGFELRGVGGQVLVPPSIHPGTGEPYSVLDEAEIAELPEWLLELWRGKIGKTSDSEVGTSLAEMREGFRHEPMLLATAKLAGRGVEMALADQLCRFYAIEHGMDPADYELVLKGAYDKFGTSGNGDFAWKPWSLADLLARPDVEPSWIVEPLFGKGDIVMIHSSPGVGKSLFLLDMLIKASGGFPFLGKFITTNTSWAVFDMDMHPNGDMMTHRAKRFARATEVKHAEPCYFLTRKHLPKGINLTTGEGLVPLGKFITENKIDVVAFDVLGAVHGAKSENDTADMDKVMSRIRDLTIDPGCAVVLLHHDRKPSVGLTDDPVHASRGSTAIRARADCVIALREKKQPVDEPVGDEGQHRDKVIVVSHTKCRYIKQLRDFKIQITDDPLLESTQLVYMGTKINDSPCTKKLEKWITETLWPQILDSGLDSVQQKDLVDAAVEAEICSARTARTGITEMERSGLIRGTFEPAPGGKGRRKMIQVASGGNGGKA